MSINGKICCIIDDDPSIRALAGKVLEGIGFEVMLAEGAIDALRQIKEKVPHLILLDLNMPEVNGFSFLKLSKENNKLHDIPIIVFSAENKEKIILKAIEMGAVDFMVKPLNSKIMIQKIRRLFMKIKQQPRIFSVPGTPEIEMQVDVDVMKMSSMELIIDGPVRMVPSKKLVKVSLDSLVLQNGNLVVCNVEEALPGGQGKGRYASKLRMQGLKDQQKDELSKLVNGWRV